MSLEIDRSSLNTAAWSIGLARWLSVPLYLCMLAALYAAFIYAPTEKEMGDVQRIFYFHVGSACNALFAFFIVFLAGAAYLWTRRRIWDQVAAASVEIGLLFTTITLITGSIWAKPVWNTWWAWGDPRLMSAMVMWLIYVAYLILRSSLPEGDRKYKYCAVFGMLGFIDAPIVFFSIRFWRTIHPVVITSSGINMDTEIINAMVVALISFMLFYVVLMLLRIAMRVHSSSLEELREQLLEAEA